MKLSLVALISCPRSETTNLDVLGLVIRNRVLVSELIDPAAAVIFRSVPFEFVSLPPSKLILSMETLAPPSISIPVVLLLILRLEIERFATLLFRPIVWLVMLGGDSAAPDTLVPLLLNDGP